MKEEYIQKGFITTTGDKHSYTLKNLFKKYLKYFGVEFSDPCCNSETNKDYKIYEAIISMEQGDNLPIVTIIHNEIGDINWSSEDGGNNNYYALGELSDAFPENKTVCYIQSKHPSYGSDAQIMSIYRINENSIRIHSFQDWDNQRSFDNINFYIKVYN